MGFVGDSINATMPRKLHAARSYEIDELYQILESKKNQINANFELKKGLFGSKIRFEKNKDLDMEIDVTTKQEFITIRPIVKETRVSVGGIRVDKNSFIRKGAGVLDIPTQRKEYLDSIADFIAQATSATAV